MKRLDYSVLKDGLAATYRKKKKIKKIMKKNLETF